MHAALALLSYDAGVTRRPLVLAPFRGLRFNPDAGGDLGTVVSPPYDVLDAAIVQELEQANRHNVVRLILSRYFEPPYQAVRRRLEQWREHDYLRADDKPGLYLYEYAVDGTTVRGLIGLLALRDDDERVVLPHEDVMSAPVADRTLLMRTTETNLEPILLVHAPTDTLLATYDAVGARPPLASFLALDGSSHRLWAMTDADELRQVAAELAPQQALIADGHHRYAAYRALERELGSGPDSPWSYGLAMLVVDNGSSLRIGPIHRVIAGLTLRDVEEIAIVSGDSFDPYADRAEAERVRPTVVTPPGWTTFWVSDGVRWAVIQTDHRSTVDAAVLHDDLLPAWHVSEEQVSYHHSLDQALQVAAREPSVVVMVQPPTLADVTNAAARGERLPRKSTSFAPKPRMGVVMRDLSDR
jgi:uncharacterized protein (DUF1015 family)